MLDHGHEPKLSELLDDPLVHLVMARDGLTPDQVRRLLQDTRDRLSRQPGRLREAA